MDKFTWWRDGIIYQIYPRSFSDSNGDGLGDLPGILSRLDYLQWLGVDAIWLSPIYPSPDEDFGYDISEYCDVDPKFGTLADFDRLVKQAHQRGIKIVMDMVLNHTSDKHPWFLESRSSSENPRRDWYIWRPPRKKKFFATNKGTVPNNWQASFGGKAWDYDPLTGEYYLHLFTRQQPDLNWRNPRVRQAMLDVFRFWLDRGVDGFRLDIFNAYFKDPDLRSNPIKPGLRAFNRQHHIHDMDQPEMLPFLVELRKLLDSYPDRYAVGETYIATPEKTVSYCGADRLHAAFSFDFTSYTSEVAVALRIFPWNPRWVAKQIMAREKVFNSKCFPTTVMSNHDLPRAVSRYIHGEDDRMAKVITTLLLTLRGTPYMYQGEEIGMRDIPLKYREIVDPPGRKYWPLYPGRDGCRSPMQWDATHQAGFTSGKPWIKVHNNYRLRNVAAQDKDPESLLNFTRRLMELRKNHAPLCNGDYIPVESSRHVLAYIRQTAEEAVLVICNFSRKQQSLTLPDGIKTKQVLLTTGRNAVLPQETRLSLEPYEIHIVLLASSGDVSPGKS